ncbi:MAG: hypothetical protein K9G48_08680 [Reyranella sp.]|nr:hypothetical protein [Reyranella sp.]
MAEHKLTDAELAFWRKNRAHWSQVSDHQQREMAAGMDVEAKLVEIARRPTSSKKE